MYRNAHKSQPVLDEVVKLCYDVMVTDFGSISKSEDFCTLKQDLMLKLIENVIPRLKHNDSMYDHHRRHGGHQQMMTNNRPPVHFEEYHLRRDFNEDVE
jgi:hypothetical protein